MSGEENSYTLKREYFGQPANLKQKEIPQNNFIVFKPDAKAYEFYAPKNPKSITITNFVEKSSHMVNTEKIPTKSVNISHVEGGWPSDVINNSETEKVQREMKNWVRAKEKTENFEKKVRELIANTEKVIHQNQLMDVYEEYFEENEKETIEDNFSAKIKMVFKDPEPFKRTVSKVVWIFPEEKEEQKKIAVAYRLLKNQDIPPNYYSPCLVWDIEKPNAPINVLSHLSEITTVAFNTKHPHILGAGCLNGTAGAFDLRENKSIGFTKIEDSHTEPVSDFVWLKSKNSNEFVTSSTDGSVIWWEIKEKEALINLVGIILPVTIAREPGKPLFLVHKDKEEEPEKEYGATKIDNSIDAGAAKFLLGTEQGIIFVVNKKKNEGELGQKLGLQSGRHLGPIVGMQRNPNNFKFILTVGDWTARIWTEDLRTPIYISKYHPAYLTDCLWTPRVGMYIVSRSDGWLSGYDICYKLNESTFSSKVSDSALTTLSLSAKGDKLIVGDEDGKVSLIKLSKSFYTSNDKTELDLKKNILNKLFEREQTREKALTISRKQQVQKEGISSSKQEENMRKRIQEIEEEYMKNTKEFVSEELPSNESDENNENKDNNAAMDGSQVKEGEDSKVREQKVEEKKEEAKEEEAEKKQEEKPEKKLEGKPEEKLEDKPKEGQQEVQLIAELPKDEEGKQELQLLPELVKGEEEKQEKQITDPNKK